MAWRSRSSSVSSSPLSRSVLSSGPSESVRVMGVLLFGGVWQKGCKIAGIPGHGSGRRGKRTFRRQGLQIEAANQDLGYAFVRKTLEVQRAAGGVFYTLDGMLFEQRSRSPAPCGAGRGPRRRQRPPGPAPGPQDPSLQRAVPKRSGCDGAALRDRPGGARRACCERQDSCAGAWSKGTEYRRFLNWIWLSGWTVHGRHSAGRHGVMGRGKRESASDSVKSS